MSRNTIIGLVLIAILLSWVPLALIARSRSRTSSALAVHLILDMDKQPKFKSQRENSYFADTRDMRPLVPGTLAREDLTLANEPLVDPDGLKMVNGEGAPFVMTSQEDYDRYMLGQEMGPDGKMRFVAHIPIPVTKDFIRRGQERFNIYCYPCHGLDGSNDGPVALRAGELMATTPGSTSGWTPPTDYQSPAVRTQPDGQIFNTITNGIRSMPRYDKQVSIMDRWAIVAYVRALELSRPPLPPAPATNTQTTAPAAAAAPSP